VKEHSISLFWKLLTLCFAYRTRKHQGASTALRNLVPIERWILYLRIDILKKYCASFFLGKVLFVVAVFYAKRLALCRVRHIESVNRRPRNWWEITKPCVHYRGARLLDLDGKASLSPLNLIICVHDCWIDQGKGALVQDVNQQVVELRRLHICDSGHHLGLEANVRQWWASWGTR